MFGWFWILLVEGDRGTGGQGGRGAGGQGGRGTGGQGDRGTGGRGTGGQGVGSLQEAGDEIPKGEGAERNRK